MSRISPDRDPIETAISTGQERGYGAHENVPSAQRALVIVEPYEFWAFYAFRTGNTLRCFTDNWTTDGSHSANMGASGFSGGCAAGYRRREGLNHSINSLNDIIENIPSVEDFLRRMQNYGGTRAFDVMELTSAYQIAGLLEDINKGWPSWCNVRDNGQIVRALDRYRDSLFADHLGIDYADIKLIGNAEINTLLKPLGAGSPHVKTKRAGLIIDGASGGT